MKQKYEVLHNHLNDIFIDSNFIGIGSTRKVYRNKDLVIKKHLHELGYLQSKNEKMIYQELKTRNLVDHIAPVLYLDEEITVQPYLQALPLKNNATYDLDIERETRITKDLREAIYVINQEFDGFDFRDSGNYGINQEGQLVLIDYGMTKTLYEEKWVPLAEAGILPQITIERCKICGEEKEIRIYGEEDDDFRCFTCGKE